MTDDVGSLIESSGPLTYEKWSRGLREGVLLGQKCRSCGKVTATPVASCRNCGTRESEIRELASEGEVISETAIEVPPSGFPESYQIAIVELEEARVLGRIDGEVSIGDRVEFSDVSVVDGDPAPVFASV